MLAVIKINRSDVSILRMSLCLYKNTGGKKRLSSCTAFKQLTSITFSSTHLVFNNFLFQSTMVFRERETEMPSWTSIIFTDTACSSSHSILFFALPIQSKKLPFCPLCHTKLKIPSFVTERLWRMLRGQKVTRSPLRQTPVSPQKINVFRGTGGISISDGFSVKCLF